MKNYLLGCFTMFLVAFILQIIWYEGLNRDNDTMVDVGFHGSEAIRGIYFVKPLTNRCTDDKRCNDCVTNAEYFNCDKFQIFLNNLIYQKVY